MPRFRFRFETLLGFRRHERDAQARRVTEAQAVLRTLDEQQAALEQQFRDEQQQMRRLAAGGAFDIDAMLAARRFVAGLRAEEQALAERRAQVEAELERRRAQLLEADRRVRVVEKLRERDLERHRQAELRAEQKQLDEVGQGRRGEGIGARG